MTLEDLEAAYLEASGGDARDALRRALADAMAEIAAVSAQVSRGYARRPAIVQEPLAQTAREPVRWRATG